MCFCGSSALVDADVQITYLVVHATCLCRVTSNRLARAVLIYRTHLKPNNSQRRPEENQTAETTLSNRKTW